jgi:hypothetical protein
MGKYPHDYSETLEVAMHKPHRVPRIRQTFKHMAAFAAVAALLTVGVPYVLDFIEYRSQVAGIKQITEGALTGTGQFCRIEVISGIQVEHCVRTVRSY